MMLGILCLVLAYIAGSFPSGLVIGKALYHTDIRDYGSHNTGATNAYRVLGAVGGLLVLICDVAKGMLGVYLGQVASQSGLGSTDTQIYFMIAGGLLAMYQTTVQAAPFKTAMTYEILLIVVIGGIGSVSGSCIASFLYIACSEWWLRFLDNEAYIGAFKVPLLRNGFRMVVFSVILMVVVLFFRTGIMGDKEFSWDRIAARCKKLFGGKKAAVSGGENHE